MPSPTSPRAADNEDLAEPLARAASAILQEQAALPRAARIELIENRAVQDRVLERICHAAIGDRVACPLKMSLSPQKDAMAPGATWSPYYTEQEAVAEKHLPTLLKLLTQPDSPLVHRDEVFALLLEIARTTSRRCPSWPNSPICSTTISSTG